MALSYGGDIQPFALAQAAGPEGSQQNFVENAEFTPENLKKNNKKRKKNLQNVGSPRSP